MISQKARILFITHDANRAGAQLFLVNIMKEMKRKGYFVGILMIRPWGGLKEDFIEAASAVYELPSQVPSLKRWLGKKLPGFQFEYLKELASNHDFDLIYANTIATGEIAVQVKKLLGVPLITHIHELRHSLELYTKEEERKALLFGSDHIIACSDAVAANLKEYDFVRQEILSTIHSFVDNEAMLQVFKDSDKTQTKKDFSLPTDKILIGACGNSEWRKGMDLFVNLAARSLKEDLQHFHFLWIGVRTDGDEYTEKIKKELLNQGIDNITLIPQTPLAKDLINALDIFVVSSREDPFPLVMLEAALCAKPILGFENTGGCTEFVKDNCGWLAPFEDTEALFELLKKMAASQDQREKLGMQGQQTVLTKYGFDQSFLKIEELLLAKLPAKA